MIFPDEKIEELLHDVNNYAKSAQKPLQPNSVILYVSPEKAIVNSLACLSLAADAAKEIFEKSEWESCDVEAARQALNGVKSAARAVEGIRAKFPPIFQNEAKGDAK